MHSARRRVRVCSIHMITTNIHAHTLANLLHLFSVERFHLCSDGPRSIVPQPHPTAPDAAAIPSSAASARSQSLAGARPQSWKAEFAVHLYRAMQYEHFETVRDHDCSAPVARAQSCRWLMLPAHCARNNIPKMRYG